MADPVPEGEVVELEETAPEVVDTDEGGAIIRDTSQREAIDQEDDFYGNLLESGALPLGDLTRLTTDLLTKIGEDKESRKEYDKDYAEGIKRTGVSGEAPGGADFQGASRAVHPMLAKASIEYNARAMAELFPGNGQIVKDQVLGTPTKARVEKAQRKVKYMNWQLKTQIPEFRSEMDRITTQTPISGSQFLFLYWDFKRKRPMPKFWPSDQVYFPYSANSIATADRLTLVETISHLEFEQRVKSGEYFVPEGEVISPSPMEPEQTEAQKQTDKAQGREPQPNTQDGVHLIGRTYTFMEFEDDPFDQGEKLLAPYCIVTDMTNNKMLSVVRNWEENDKELLPMQWLAEVPFLPWRGPLSLGLVQFIGSLAGASTGALRALLDSAHINNLPTLIKLKGANFVGQSETAEATQITEVEGAIAGDQDIRKLMMAIPFNPPSQALFQLLGFVTDEGRQFVQTALDKLGEQRTDMPVGTTLALIEQGLKTLSGIHGRLYDAMNRILLILHRLNRMYVTDEEIVDDTGERLAFRSDFQGPLDVVPVSDPEVFSDIQRFAQMQLVAQRSQLLPQLYNLRKVEELILERTKIPNAKDLLLPEQKAQEMNQVNENVAMAMGRPVVAYPEQDHLAHMQVLLDFLTNPFLGMSPLIGPRFIPAALQHLMEHMLLWYTTCYYEGATEELKQELSFDEAMKDKDPETKKEIDRLLAEMSGDISEKIQKTFQKLPPVIQRAQQFLEALAPQMPPDPSLQREQMVQAGKDKDRQIKQIENDQKQKAETERVILKEAGEDRRSTQHEVAETERNTADNLSALAIANDEIASGERVAVESSAGDPNPQP